MAFKYANEYISGINVVGNLLCQRRLISVIVNESEMKCRRYSVIYSILLLGVIFTLGIAACLLEFIMADTVL